MVRHALFARNKTQHSPVADEWARDHVKMKFAARKRRSLITMCRDFAACFDNEAVPPAPVLQISLCHPRPVLVRRASAFLLPVLRRHELGTPRRATLRLCSAACRPSCSSAVCSGAGLCLSTPSGTVLLSPPIVVAAGYHATGHLFNALKQHLRGIRTSPCHARV
eukprot:gene23080-biopygen19301